MKLLAFAATNSSRSINRQLVGHAVRVLEEERENVDVELIDLNDFEMPIYSIDRQNADGIPQLAHDFFKKITDADALVISFAEHNGSYTAAYKNIFDWASRIDMRVYQNKATVMLSTSPGPRGAGNVLQAATDSAQFFGNDLRASLSIPNFHDNFDPATGTLIDPDLGSQLRAALNTLNSDALEPAR